MRCVLAEQRFSHYISMCRPFQIARHHLALGERAKRSRVADFPTKFQTDHRGLQIVGVRQRVFLDLDGVERIGSRQTDPTSALRPRDTSE